MNINLKIFLITKCILLIINVYLKVLKKDLDFKNAFAWMTIILLLMILCIFDNILVPIKNLFGFELVSNMIFFMGFIFISLLLLSLSIKVNKQNEKITKLTQELAIIKKDSKNEKSNK